MKHRIYSITLIVVFLFSCKKKETTLIKPVNAQPDLVSKIYQDLEGNDVFMEDYIGKKVLLNFWATWCQPCIKEMPSLLKAHNILKNEDYTFLLASDEPVEKIKEFKEVYNFNFNFIKFTGSLSQLKIYALPKTFIYNKKGEKVDEISGAVKWDSEQMINKLKSVN